MAETMTKNTPKSAKFSWKTLIENLAGKRERAIADYQDLIDRMAGGEEITEAAIEAALAKCGKSVFDLQSDVAAKAERVEWVAEIERLRAVVADGEQAAHDDERLVAEHNATVERMLIELDKIRSGLRPRVHAGTAAASRIGDLEHKLRSSPPSHLTEQQAAVSGKIREAVTIHTRRENEWVDIKTAADRAEREQSEGWQMLVAERDLRKRLADEAAAELKELQAQTAQLADAMVQP